MKRRNIQELSDEEKLGYYNMCMDAQDNVRFIQEVPSEELQGLLDLPANEFCQDQIRAELARRNRTHR